MPFWAGCGNFQQAELFVKGERSPDSLMNGKWPNLVSEQVPAFRFFQYPANNVQLAVYRRVCDSGCFPLADEGQNLVGRDAADLHVTEQPIHNLCPISLRANAQRRKAGDPILQELLGSLAECQPRKAVSGRRELACLCSRNQFFFFRLSLPPVAGIERLPEPLTVNEEMRVPRLTAFYE
ncbi:MAG TPA: hypothetical protein VKB58_06820 [Terriglobales bacterium]|nr:hypothetical protein [Terriglobales bacterium]